MTAHRRQVFFEIVYQGSYAKCSAIDAETNIEVSIVAPASYSRYTLEQNARRKLERALEQRGYIRRP